MHEPRSTIKRKHDERRRTQRGAGAGRLSPCCESWLVEQTMIEARMMRERAPAPAPQPDHPK